MTVAQNQKLSIFGIKGGLNRSVISGKQLDGTETGFIGVEIYGSISLDTELSSRWRFENELLISWTDEYYFLEIPLRFKHETFERVFFTAGPKIDMVLNNDDETYDFNNFGVSLELGAQYMLTKRIISEFRYSHGLITQINDIVLDIYDGRRNTLRFGLGYRL
ncbi:MAG: outer membrane beta-barrel protein [Cyclobacteriaceae bacterium]|nr:outer membrane beta-barrel protein [Cyclobacteriaceae bacterium]